MWSVIIGSCLIFAGISHARDPAPVLLPSSQWRGIDGNWSTISFSLGSNSQDVDVLVSTALSEFWAIGSGGCLPKEPHCNAARGGIFEPKQSTNWDSLGIWQLGLDHLHYGGNGEYGLDSITSQSLTMDEPFIMSSVLVAAVNTTNYLNGLLGLGINQGSFGDKVMRSPLTDAVSTYGWIPSYSFGYTAGAHYRNSPVSLTLGGVDKSRYTDHSTDFTISQADNLERTLVRGIELTAADGQDTPADWLTSWNTSYEALIDSTTPYLWLPTDICDEFARALDLTYDETFQLYTLSNDQYRNFSREDAYSFTFVLSSFDHTDNFGDPYDVTGIVNITIPSRALVGLLQYPFMNESISYGDPAVPYFMLRKSLDTTYVLGRSFLQETYLITKYDEGVFSIHQAEFPDAPFSESGLTAITRPNNSPYPPPAVKSSSRSGLTTGGIAGIGVASGAFAALVAVLAVWLCSRRQKKNHINSRISSAQDSHLTPASNAEASKSPIFRLLSRIAGRREWASDNSKNSQQVSEAPNTQIYELPAPIPPAELNGDDATSWNGDTELGTDNSNDMSAYEVARRKMDRQLQGPVPAYSPPKDGVMPLSGKMAGDNNYATVQQRNLQPSPTSSTRLPRDGGSTGNLVSVPSPIAPRYIDYPSPMTATMPVSSTDGTMSVPISPLAASSNSQSHDSNRLGRDRSDREQPVYDPYSREPSQPSIQRTPIDPSKTVLLGALPGDARFRRQSSHQIVPDHPNYGDVGRDDTDEDGPYNSLGSNFTIEEERRVHETARHINATSASSSERHGSRPLHTRISGTLPSPGVHMGATEPGTPRSQERINLGIDLVHVPQMAEKRYSWEDDR